MTTHSSILALEILWIEESGGLHTVLGVTDSDMTDGLSTHTHTHTHTEPRRTVKIELLIKKNFF